MEPPPDHAALAQLQIQLDQQAPRCVTVLSQRAVPEPNVATAWPGSKIEDKNLMDYQIP